MRSRSLLAFVAFVLVLAGSPRPAAAAEAGKFDAVTQARAALDEGRHEDARRLLRAPAKGGDAEALYWLGCVELEAGEADAALDVFEELVELEPDRARSHFAYGRACHLKVESVAKLFQIKWAKRVRSSFERAHELDRTDPDILFALVRFHREAPGLVGGDRERAWTHARELARLEPRRGEPLLGEMHREEGDHAAAAEAYRRALVVLPEERGVHYLLAICLADAGRGAESFAAIDAYTELVADDPVVPYLVGRTAAITGTEPARGRAALEAYLRTEPAPGAPTPAAAHWRLGNLSEHAGDFAAARGSYRRALELDPGFEKAKESLKALPKR